VFERGDRGEEGRRNDGEAAKTRTR
jgi:hypothetical protein